jgi:hypothetical protein
MKKLMFLMVVAGMFALAGCEKNEVWSDLDPKTIDPSAIWQQHDRWSQPGTVDGGLLTLTCDNHFGYQQYQGEYQSFCVYRMSGMNRPSVAEQLNGCYTVDTTNHELVAADGTRPGVNINHLYDTILVAEIEGDPHHTNYASFLTPCHADLIQVCFDTTNHKVVGHYRDEHGNSLSAEGEWWGVQTRTVIVHDTVEHHTTDTVVVRETDTVEVRVTDTVRQVVYDTVFEYRYDTINDTVIRTIVRIDSVVTTITRNINYVDQHTSWDSVRVISGGCRVWGTNTVTYVVVENGAEVSRGTQPWRHYSDFTISGIAGVNFPTSVNGGVFNVNTTTGTTNVGGHNVTSTNIGNHIYGTVMVNGFNMTGYLVPCEPIAYQWSFNDPNATLAFRDVHGHQAGTYTTTYNSNTPATITRIDTLWGDCGTATAWYQAVPAEQVRATVGKTYRLVRTWSDSHTDTVNGGTATATYVWNVVRTGQPTSAMASTLPVNGNPASFGGGAFTEALSQVGSQRFCPLTWNSATLTSSTSTMGTTTWSGTYGTSTVTVSVPEAFLPTPSDTTITVPGQILFVGVTLSVRNDITPGLVNPEYYVNVVYSAGGTVHHSLAPLTGFNSGTTFTDATVSATAAQIQSYIAAGKYPAKCYNHVTMNYVLGTVNEVLSGSQWVIQWFSYTNRTSHYNTINSISNVFVDGEHPAIIQGSFITTDGTITINGANYTFTGSSL